MDTAAAPLVRVAVYEREIHASLERVWENVLDWEHLPSLHHQSFAAIRCVEAGPAGWRAQIGLPPDGARNMTVELRTESEQRRYVAETVEGPGVGTEIWTWLDPVAPQQTNIRVEFLLPGVPSEHAEKIGRALVDTYRVLWDQDEAMMQRREQMLALVSSPPERSPAPLLLGSLEKLRARLPLLLEFAGRPYRVLELDGELVAHATICPHLLGPLDEACLEAGEIECPWHGYRFDVRSGRSVHGDCPSLDPAPRVEVDPASSTVRLVR